MSEPVSADRPAVLLADIGGTNARFALLVGDAITSIGKMKDADFASFDDALAAYLADQGQPALSGAVLALPGTIANGRCKLTNNHWTVEADSLRARFGLRDVRMMNDFEAVGWALPVIPRDRLRQVGSGAALAGAPMAALGAGTGLGVTLHIPAEPMPVVRPSEGGHVTLGGTNAREDAVIAELRARFGHASAERALSGPGIENLYAAIGALDGLALPPRDAAAITASAIDGSCATCLAAMNLFASLLGNVAGNLALTVSARGGLFIAGGIVHHIADFLVQSAFRESFEAKGRFRDYLVDVPTYLILEDYTAFLGLKNYVTLHAKR